jgi:hypothetical protein
LMNGATPETIPFSNHGGFSFFQLENLWIWCSIMNSNGISFGSVHPRQRRRPYWSKEHRRYRGVVRWGWVIGSYITLSYRKIGGHIIRTTFITTCLLINTIQIRVSCLERLSPQPLDRGKHYLSI